MDSILRAQPGPTAIPIDQAARRAGVSFKRVLAMVKAGEIPAILWESKYHVSADCVEMLKRSKDSHSFHDDRVTEIDDVRYAHKKEVL